MLLFNNYRNAQRNSRGKSITIKNKSTRKILTVLFQIGEERRRKKDKDQKADGDSVTKPIKICNKNRSG